MPQSPRVQLAGNPDGTPCQPSACVAHRPETSLSYRQRLMSSAPWWLSASINSKHRNICYTPTSRKVAARAGSAAVLERKAARPSASLARSENKAQIKMAKHWPAPNLLGPRPWPAPTQKAHRTPRLDALRPSKPKPGRLDPLGASLGGTLQTAVMAAADECPSPRWRATPKPAPYGPEMRGAKCGSGLRCLPEPRARLRFWAKPAHAPYSVLHICIGSEVKLEKASSRLKSPIQP